MFVAGVEESGDDLELFPTVKVYTHSKISTMIFGTACYHLHFVGSKTKAQRNKSLKALSF